MTADHQPVLTPLPAGLFATGAGAGLATALTGVWLMTAPFATGYQPADAEWVDATRVGVWTGVLLVLGGLAVTGMFAGALREELRRRGLRPAAAEPTDRRLTSATSPDGPGGSADGDLGGSWHRWRRRCWPTCRRSRSPPATGPTPMTTTPCRHRRRLTPQEAISVPNSRITAALVLLGVTMVAGIWLFVAPFVVEYQPVGADWTTASLHHVVTGAALAAGGLLLLVGCAAMTLRQLERATAGSSTGGRSQRPAGDSTPDGSHRSWARSPACSTCSGSDAGVPSLVCGRTWAVAAMTMYRR